MGSHPGAPPAAGEPVPGPRVLVVDGDQTIANLVLHVVRMLGFGALTHVRTGREALEAGESADIVLLDHQLPDASGSPSWRPFGPGPTRRPSS